MLQLKKNWVASQGHRAPESRVGTPLRDSWACGLFLRHLTQPSSRSCALQSTRHTDTLESFATPLMKYVKWYPLICIPKLFWVLFPAPLWSGKSQGGETEEMWWRWGNRAIRVQIKTSHGTSLAAVPTRIPSSCLHIMFCWVCPRNA